MRYQCCDSIRPSRDVPASCHILPREGDAKSTAAERTRCHAFPHFNPSLQPQLVDIGYPKGVFRGLSAHAGGSASCDSATTLFKPLKEPPCSTGNFRSTLHPDPLHSSPILHLPPHSALPRSWGTTHLCSLCFSHLEHLSCSAPYAVICASADGNCFVTAKYGLS